jgi:hypothetical protein
MAFKPKIKVISDIFVRLIAGLPLQGEYRENLEREWEYLEKRIEGFYKRK